MVRDRITRVRYERTMTMKEPKSTSKGFDHILTQEEAEGLGPEEKMKLIAAKMEEKFKVVERRVSSTVTANCTIMFSDCIVKKFNMTQSSSIELCYFISFLEICNFSSSYE